MDKEDIGTSITMSHQRYKIYAEDSVDINTHSIHLNAQEITWTQSVPNENPFALPHTKTYVLATTSEVFSLEKTMLNMESKWKEEQEAMEKRIFHLEHNLQQLVNWVQLKEESSCEKANPKEVVDRLYESEKRINNLVRYLNNHVYGEPDFASLEELIRIIPEHEDDNPIVLETGFLKKSSDSSCEDSDSLPDLMEMQ